jgi:hypothetical protein
VAACCIFGNNCRNSLKLSNSSYERKTQERIEMTGRGRRHKRLLDGLKEKRGYVHLKKEALDGTVWRTDFGRGYRPVETLTTERTKERTNERTNERTKERTNERTNQRKNERTKERKNELTNQRTNQRKNERTKERTN